MMATFQRFEEIEGWQKGRELTRAVYSVSNQGLFAKDYGLRDQTGKKIGGLMRYLRQTNYKGPKYK